MGDIDAADDTLVDRYFLRDLIWCGGCDRSLVPLLGARQPRYYGCANWECSQGPVPADGVEQRVWQRFAGLNEAAARGVRGEHRRAALRQVLRRVVVGAGHDDLRFEWRD